MDRFHKNYGREIFHLFLELIILIFDLLQFAELPLLHQTACHSAVNRELPSPLTPHLPLLVTTYWFLPIIIHLLPVLRLNMKV